MGEKVRTGPLIVIGFLWLCLHPTIVRFSGAGLDRAKHIMAPAILTTALRHREHMNELVVMVPVPWLYGRSTHAIRTVPSPTTIPNMPMSSIPNRPEQFFFTGGTSDWL